MNPPRPGEEEKPNEPQASLYSPRFVGLLLVQFVFGLGFSSFLLLPKYLASVHHSDADLIGRMMAAAPLAAVLVLPFLARRIDSWPRHWLMAGGALVMFLGSLGFAGLERLEPWGYLWRVLHGAAFTAYVSSAATLAVDFAPKRSLGQAVGLIGAANLATNALAPAIAEPLAAAHGWRPVFLLSALASLLAAAGALLLRDGRPLRASLPPRVSLFEPGFLRLIYAGVIVGVSFGTVLAFYQPLAMQLGIRELSQWFVGYTISALGVRVLGGPWLDRFDRKRLSLAASGLYAVSVLATAALQPGWLLPLGLVLGLAHGTLWPVLTALCVEAADAKARGTLMTYFGGSFNVGVFASMLGFGELAHAVGYRPVIALSGLLAISSCAVLATRERVIAEPESIGLAR